MLENLHLRYFRNHEELNFQPGEGFIVLTGPNGAGKSNLLEGIYYLGAGYTYRHVQDEALVQWGADFFVIRASVLQNGLKYDLEIAYQTENKRKSIKINSKKGSLGACAAYLPVVIFSPADLLLIQGAPALRRRFLDLVVTQIKPQHAADIHDYSGILNQRNNLLRQGSPPAHGGYPAGTRRAELDPWDEQLVFVGARIISRRLAVFKKMLGLCREAFASLSHSDELDGVYISQAIPPRSVEDDEGFCRQAFRDALERRRSLDERLRVTTTGPHRDDLCFFLRGHEAHLYCSQGEQRLIALALKLAQSRLLSGAAASEPLLLLDDVFSELDEAHREKVLQELAQKRQVIATTTSFVENGEKATRQLTPEISLFRV